MTTHHNATFIGLSTDGEHLYFGLSENGTSAAGNYDVDLYSVANMIRSECLSSLNDDRPLVIVVAKTRKRATAGEVFLHGFALALVRDFLQNLPREYHLLIGGGSESFCVSFYHPRVETVLLPVEARYPDDPRGRLRLLLDLLAFGDLGLELIPKGVTYVGE